MIRAILLKVRPRRARELPRCPHFRNQAGWCRRMCVPMAGTGTCGRLAPHAMKDRIQRAIARQLAEEDG